MFERKVVKTLERLVRRMSAAHPAGEFVCPSDRHVQDAGPGEVHERGFRESRDGSDKTETDLNALPARPVAAVLEVGR